MPTAPKAGMSLDLVGFQRRGFGASGKIFLEIFPATVGGFASEVLAGLNRRQFLARSAGKKLAHGVALPGSQRFDAFFIPSAN